MIKLVGFAPDLDPMTPGILTDCSQCIPTQKGMTGAPSAYDPGITALGTACLGAIVLTKLDGTRRVIAGTGTKLNELSGDVWTDVSHTGGYTSTSDTFWCFTQFGNGSIATNHNMVPQYSTSGAFVDIADAPKCKIIFSVAGFLMALHINDSRVGGDRPDAWFCSNLYDYVTWTPAAGNQAAYGYFLDRAGPIIGGKALGNYAIAYKEKSIHIGQYVGPPTIWAWETVPGEVGAISANCIVDTGTSHLFVGRDDFWIFDGARAVSIGTPLREWFFRNSDATYRYKMRGVFDRVGGRVWWFYASLTSGGTLDQAVVFDVKSGKWGLATVTIEAALEFTDSEVTWDNWPPGASTDFDNIADVPFDSPSWDTVQPVLATFNTSHKVVKLSGANVSSYMITGDFGSDSEYSTLDEVKPGYLTRPTTASMSNYTKEYQGDAVLLRDTNSINGNKFNVSTSGRLHRVKIETTGDYEITGYEPKLIEDGEE